MFLWDLATFYVVEFNTAICSHTLYTLFEVIIPRKKIQLQLAETIISLVKCEVPFKWKNNRFWVISK